MSLDLTNEEISQTYQRVVQYESGSYYDGLGNFIGSSSFAESASYSNTSSFSLTSSYYGGSVISSSYALTASYINTASYALTATIADRLSNTSSVNIGSASINYQQTLYVNTGSYQTVTSTLTGSYRAAFFDYVVFSSSVSRAGTLYAVWSGSTTEWYEQYTSDIGGSTSTVVLRAAISSSNIELQATSSSEDWTIRSLIRLI